MAAGLKILRCVHCGEPIQYEDKNRVGYVSPETYLNRKSSEPIYCEKCYQELLDLNKIEEDIAVDESIYSILDDAIKSKALIIWTVDLVSFNGHLPSTLASKLRKNSVIVVGTRKDFFPKPINEKQLREFLEYSFNQVGIKPLDIIAINAKDQKECVDAINRVTEKYKSINTLDMYLIGPEGCGKTTLISTFLKNYENNSDRYIARVEYKDTGIKILETPISNRRTLYELPGYSNNQSVLSKLEKSIHKYIIPKKMLKVVPTQLGLNNAFIIGSICAIEIKSGPSTTYKFFSGEKIEARKALISNVRKTMMTNKINEMFRPVSQRLKSYNDYDVIEFNIPKDNKMHELAAEGMGFVIFKGVGQKIWVIIPKGTSVNEGVNRY